MFYRVFVTLALLVVFMGAYSPFAEEVSVKIDSQNKKTLKITMNQDVKAVKVSASSRSVTDSVKKIS